jgi:hypothetical protein
MTHPKIVSYKAYQVIKTHLELFIEAGFTGIQVADYGIAQEYRTKGVRQMRKERQFVNGDYQRVTILLSGFDELGNNCVVTSDLLYYQLTEELV